MGMEQDRRRAQATADELKGTDTPAHLERVTANLRPGAVGPEQLSSDPTDDELSEMIDRTRARWPGSG